MIFLTNTGLMIYLAAALVPPILLLRYIYRQDKVEPEPPKLLALLIVGGVLAGFLSLILELIFEVPVMMVAVTATGYAILDALMVGLVEEGCKLLFLRLFSWKNSAFDYLFDGMVYAVFVSLGFAAMENILYVFQYGLATALVRAVTSIPGHACFGVLMGIFYTQARQAANRGDTSRSRKCMLCAWLVPMIAHWFYDAIAGLMEYSSTMVWLLLFIVLLVILYISAFRLVKMISRTDRPND